MSKDASSPKLKVTIYSDGGCKPNPGPGGWGAILHCPAKKMRKELSGFEARTTNNRMELTAVTRALEALKSTCEVTVFTDSKYLANALERNFGQSKRLWHLATPHLGFLPPAVEEHLELVEAIQAGDGERSEAIMRRHVGDFYAQVRQVLRAMD